MTMSHTISFQTLGDKVLIINANNLDNSRTFVQKQWMFLKALEDQFSETVTDIVLTSNALTLFFKDPIVSKLQEIQLKILERNSKSLIYVVFLSFCVKDQH